MTSSDFPAAAGFGCPLISISLISLSFGCICVQTPENQVRCDNQTVYTVISWSIILPKAQCSCSEVSFSSGSHWHLTNCVVAGVDQIRHLKSVLLTWIAACCG